MATLCNDYAVIGGGPAGLLAALLLARAGNKVTLFDRNEPNQVSFKIGESVPPAFANLLAHLQLNPLSTSVHCPIWGSRTLWAGEYLERDFIDHPQGHGWRLDRIAFEADLRQQMISEGVSVVHLTINHIEEQNDGWSLHDDTGFTHHCNFLIDASGRSGIASRKLGITREKGEPLIAVACVGKPSAETHYLTYTESQRTGWWYAAYLPNTCPIAIFHTTPRYAQEILRTPDHWHHQLNSTQLVSSAFQTSLFLTQPLRAHQARSMRLTQVYGKNWASCGDAALSFDPISSQGIFNALATAHQLATALMKQDRLTALAEYETQIRHIESIYARTKSAFYSRLSQAQATN